MKALAWLDKYFEMSIGIVLLTIISILLFVQVIMRRVFDNALFWSEEMARYMFIWLIYISVSQSTKLMRHIKIDSMLGIFPKKLRPYVVLLGDLLFLAFSIFIVFTSYDILQRQIMWGQYSPAMRLPMWVVYAAPMVGFALTTVRLIQLMVIHHLQLFRKPAVKERGE